MMVNYLAVYTESKNDSPGFSIWDTRQQALDAKVPKGMVLWDVIEIKDDATFGAETFEAPKTMTPTQAKKKFVSLLKPYWVREIKPYAEDTDAFEEDLEVYNGWLRIAKAGKVGQYNMDTGDTAIRDYMPESFYFLQLFDNNDYDTWEDAALGDYELPKSLQKQLKALLPAIKGGVAKPKPKARKKTTTRKAKAPAKKAKPKARKTTRKKKTGRKAPTISATKRKVGTRMRGNDGKMWQVKKSGKSQRWMAGAEGVVYTGNYQTNDDYNPYKYVNQAPFGAEEVKDLCLNWTPTVDAQGNPLLMGGPCWDCKVCSEQGRTPELLQEYKDTGWFTPKGEPKPDRRQASRSRLSDMVFNKGWNNPRNRPSDYNITQYDAEETEPMNMKGAVGMITAIIGIILWKA